jgi:hypothetical protein
MVSEQEIFRLIERLPHLSPGCYQVRRKGVDVFVTREELTPKEFRQIRENLLFLSMLFYEHTKYFMWLESRLAESLPKNPMGHAGFKCMKRRDTNSRGDT